MRESRSGLKDPRHYSPVVQLVECCTVNAEIGGSNPPGRAKIRDLKKRALKIKLAWFFSFLRNIQDLILRIAADY